MVAVDGQSNKTLVYIYPELKADLNSYKRQQSKSIKNVDLADKFKFWKKQFSARDIILTSFFFQVCINKGTFIGG